MVKQNWNYRWKVLASENSSFCEVFSVFLFMRVMEGGEHQSNSKAPKKGELGNVSIAILKKQYLSALRAEPATVLLCANLAAEHSYFYVVSSQFVKERCKQ